jgi:chromate transporter
VFWVFLRLGLTSFGRPVAHLGYFRDEFVVRRRWLTEHSYADLVALCQFLPGPASSQVGMALGLMRGGWGGALAAWVGFTLPSALALALLGLGFSAGGFGMPAGLVQGLKVVAVAVVAQAVWGMARGLCATAGRAALMLAACAVTLLQPGWWANWR